MKDSLTAIGEALRRCTRNVVTDGPILSNAELRGDLGMDSLGLLMLFELLGQKLQIDPVALSRRSARLVTVGDLVAEVDSLLKR